MYPVFSLRLVTVLYTAALAVSTLYAPQPLLPLLSETFAVSREQIGLLLTVDWFLDRCRTGINVLGDVNVSCLIDGRTPPAGSGPPATQETG